MKKVLFASLLALSLGACKTLDVASAIEAGSSLFQAASISDDEMKAIGLQSAKKLDAENKTAPASNAYAKRLNKITKNFKSYNGIPLNFKVYLTKSVNAFALPNGDVRVYAGLMDLMTDDEVLFVVGHEIGHVIEGHSKARMRTNLLATAARQAAVASGNSIASTLSSGEIGELAHNFVNAQYSQSQEYDADTFGLKILKENNRPKEAGVSALRKLASLNGGSNASILSSHPDSLKRAERIANMK
ncbi:M48 family metallopeptidase [Pelistega ratti]|uniref:M48 family metallopeptidase n=1 Tax=Pelistega ratti TaxID=2652177 RepID=UPI001FAA6B7E|nr:M48 family metallopeptidase [Pelistega ratti]